MSETTTMDVIVTKSIDLMKGETLAQFTSALSGKGREYLYQKLNLVKDKDGCYMAEVMSNVAVFDVYRSKTGAANQYGYYAVKFDRDKDGTFKFGDVVEVERVTTYQPKSMTAVSKSADGQTYISKHINGDSALESVLKSRSKVRAKPRRAPDHKR
jgi:hypothetical protein